MSEGYANTRDAAVREIEKIRNDLLYAAVGPAHVILKRI